ncbi:hypothetical protein UFOVP55_52 [uncultured Caudovirales phage]|uniref:Uncharacterized protein n=1 Tax=uncultured Caudovirales phage TaxID=2100421 RepID=A0A6J5KVB0_9CAUD|nr:hypothetical protein UFOVP55_52 [uncultured Caudovirales phage]
MNALPTSASNKLVPVCSDCATIITEGTADIYYDKEKQDWCISEVVDVAWCAGCEESNHWHYAELHDIEEPPNDFTK